MNDIISRVGLVFSDMMLPVATQSLDWLTSIITAIVTSVSSVMLGVVLFTLVLKVITLPLDYFFARFHAEELFEDGRNAPGA